MRETARVLLIDERDRLLLARVIDTVRGATFWCTPGGGLDPGESFETGAMREVAEETGLAVFDLGPCIWVREHRGTFMGHDFHVFERLFVARVPTFEPFAAAYTELEKLVQVEMRWWSLDELEAAGVAFAPTRLPALYRKLLEEGAPAEPIDVGV